MKDIDNISEKVEKRKLQLQALFTKDEENYDLWAGKEQIFDTHKMAINITGTEMVEKATKVQASLNRSRLDIHVYPPDKYANPDAPDAANQEERMYYYGFDKADERLALTGKAPLLPSTTWQTVVLGRTAVRVLVYLDSETGEIVWDFLPLTPRFLSFAFDSKGLAWVCYETFRNADSIKEEYKKDVTEDTEGKGLSVSDYWDREHNVRYLTKTKEVLRFEVNGKMVSAWKHPFGEVPIIFQSVARAPMSITSEGINVTSWGESIFDPIKIPFKNLNKMRSIAATHAHLLAKAPLDVTYTGDKPGITDEHFDRYPGGVFEHPDTTKIEGMRIPDIPSSLMAMMGDISAGIQKVTYTELNPDKPAHSGAGLRILGQDKQDVEYPRVATLNVLYTRICRMVKKQIIAQDLTIPVITVKNKAYETFDIKPEFLNQDFYVNAELVRQDVYDEEASLSRAQMLKQNGFMCTLDILERVLLEQDAPTQLDKIDIESIEAAIPELLIKKRIKKLMNAYQASGDEELKEEADLLKVELALLLIEKQQQIASLMGQGAEGQPPQESPQGGMPPQEGGPPPGGMPPQGPPRGGMVPPGAPR